MNSKNLSNHVLPFSEHCGAWQKFHLEEQYAHLLSAAFYEQWFPKTHRGKNRDMRCFYIQKNVEDNSYNLETGYFIGVDWVIDGEVAIYVEPKLNVKQQEDDPGKLYEVDYLKMLFMALEYAESEKELKELFHIKWGEKAIEIPQKQDLLTPLLIVQFLAILKRIVRKGLKKSYYKVQRNLKSRIKGKVLVGQNIKQNQAQAKYLNTWCSYDEFGINNKENKLLKKALIFIKRYLSQKVGKTAFSDLQDSFNFVRPAFSKVADDIELREVKQLKVNAFYKEYTEAIRLAKLILKRFGYNISTISETEHIKIPPFWIDMSKLFELYVLKKLRERFISKSEIKYQEAVNGLYPDYLLASLNGEYKIVVDAKYKKYSQRPVDLDDIRQISAYARMEKVYELLKKPLNEIVDCLIIYPDIVNPVNLATANLTNKIYSLSKYLNFYAIGIDLPLVKTE